MLINKLIKHMLGDRDAEFTAGQQMSQVLRILLDPEGILAVNFCTNFPIKMFKFQKEKGEFLQMFYKRAIQTLCSPITENAKDGRPICGEFRKKNSVKFSEKFNFLR